MIQDLSVDDKLDKAEKLICDIWDTIVPDYPVEDPYFSKIDETADGILNGIKELRIFVDDFKHHGSPKWNPEKI